MARPVRVLLDVDEVVADFVGYYLYLANKKTTRGYKREQVTEWDIAKALDLPQWAKFEIEFELSQPGAAHNLALHAGAGEAVKELAKYADIVFVSAPYKMSKYWEHDRREWLERKFGKNHKFICTDFKTPIAGDVFVDDRPENVKPWIEENIGTAVLWDQAHNQGFEHPLIKRMNSWPELIDLVKAKRTT